MNIKALRKNKSSYYYLQIEYLIKYYRYLTNYLLIAIYNN